MSVDPALFYTGIVAELYAPLRSVTQDPEPYARFIQLAGQPTLELGCGDGDPLLDLRRRGIDVEGVDSSADMLDRCRRRAETEGLDVVVHHQRMESLDLGRRFRSIFLAGPTFNLLPDDDTARAALVAIRTHLDDAGGALIPLFVPDVVPAAELGRVREAVEPDGSVIRFSVIGVDRNETERRQEMLTRYERISDGDPIVVERPWVVHWHTQSGFRELAGEADLSTVAVLDAEGGVADASATASAFWLAPAS